MSRVPPTHEFHRLVLRACSALMVAVLAALGTSPVRATPSISDRRDFSISDCSSAKIPLRFIADAPPLAIRTDAIRTKQGTPLPWSIVWDKPTPSDPTAISEYQTNGTLQWNCPRSGKFDVTLSVFLPGPPVTRHPLQFGITRQAEPTLDVPSALTLILGRSRLGGGDTPPSLSIPLHEGSSLAPLEDLSVSGSQLRKASGEYDGIMIRPSDSTTILPANSVVDYKAQLSSLPDPGLYTGHVSPSSATAALCRRR